MSFGKNVQKYQKWVLGSIVAVMALSLVVSFGNFNPDGGEGAKPFATIFGTVTVTEREWQEAYAKSGAWFRLKAVRMIDEGTDYSSQQISRNLFRLQEQGGPGMLAFHQHFQASQEDRVASARELIILGYDARAKQVRASEEEVEEIIRGFLARAGFAEDDVERHAEFSRRYFLAEQDAFKAAVRDAILIEKALSLDVGGCNISYENLFIEKLSSSRSMRVLVAGIDGAKLPGDIVPVTDDEIRAQFDQQRENFKMPARIQIEYLMAVFDDFKSRIKDPTPEEIQKYYEEHKREFLIPATREEGHHEGDGHDHPAPKEEFKPLEKVREEIIKKIKDRLATNDAYNAIKNISSKDIAGRWYKLLEEENAREPKDPKSVRERALARTGPILTELRDKYKAQGIDLKNGITLPFEKNAREPFEKELGKSTTRNDPIEWAFQGPVGEVAHQIYQSDKGIALVRIAHKIEGYETDLTGPVREKIRQDLLKDRAAGRARRLADEIVTRIRLNGPAELARLRTRSDVTIQRSTYIAQGTPDSETGLAPPALAQQVKSKVLNPSTDPALSVAQGGIEAQAIHGDVIGGDRKDWAYVVVVEDSVQEAPEVKDQEFLQDVRRKETEEVARARAAQATKLVASAEWKETAAPPPAP